MGFLIQKGSDGQWRPVTASDRQEGFMNHTIHTMVFIRQYLISTTYSTIFIGRSQGANCKHNCEYKVISTWLMIHVLCLRWHLSVKAFTCNKTLRRFMVIVWPFTCYWIFMTFMNEHMKRWVQVDLPLAGCLQEDLQVLCKVMKTCYLQVVSVNCNLQLVN